MVGLYELYLALPPLTGAERALQLRYAFLV
jgi:hypothetical protein